MKNSRRQFMILSAAGACTLAMNGKVQAQAMVADADPQAVALGYKSDATKADKAKYPKYAAGQACSNCALYQGAAGSASGACPLFAGKQVAAKGWCSAYAKKG
jgi:High potential iron-sulfur protein